MYCIAQCSDRHEQARAFIKHVAPWGKLASFLYCLKGMNKSEDLHECTRNILIIIYHMIICDTVQPYISVS